MPWVMAGSEALVESVRKRCRTVPAAGVSLAANPFMCSILRGTAGREIEAVLDVVAASSSVHRMGRF